MKEKPILFNTEMVRAILDGRKTQTRRIVKPVGEQTRFWKPLHDRFIIEKMNCEWQIWLDKIGNPYTAAIPPYEVGDMLWVRETWGDYREFTEDGESGFFYLYKADYPDGARTVPLPETEKTDYAESWALPRWRPSIHMPREAARIFLRVKDVRAEKLQSITPEDVKKEGVKPAFVRNNDLPFMWENTLNASRMLEFINLWNSTIKPQDRSLYGWNANPWVWVVEFERIKDGGDGDA